MRRVAAAASCFPLRLNALGQPPEWNPVNIRGLRHLRVLEATVCTRTLSLAAIGAQIVRRLVNCHGEILLFTTLRLSTEKRTHAWSKISADYNGVPYIRKLKWLEDDFPRV